MAYCGIENECFCGRIDCLYAATFFCSYCDISNGDDYLKYYEKPITNIETKYEYEQRISDLPF